MTDPSALARTPLHSQHVEAGARLVEFAGFEMPVQYAGVIDEHRAVRTAAGLFDVSHMGEFRVHGPGAFDFLQGLTPNDVSKLQPGRAHYSGLLTESGTYIDDLLIYQLGEGDYMLVVNAANRVKDLAWISGHPHDGCEIEDLSDDYALLALQGPKAIEILAPLTGVDLEGLRYYRFAEGEVAGRKAIVSRTGYTGEDGVELYLAPAVAPAVWDALLEAGSGAGLVPAGLGARDTLRLEAGMALYGHEIDAETTPFEAGLSWVVKLDKGEFVGREALVAQREAGVPRKLVGFEIEGRGIAREGHGVFHDDKEVAKVASGSWSPTFEKAIGTALVPPELAEPGTELEIEVRRRRLSAKVAKLPFYRRS